MGDQFAQRLKLCRVVRGVSRRDMGELLGLSENGYGRYERGERMPSAFAVVKLADFFNVSTDWLMGLIDSPARGSR